MPSANSSPWKHLPSQHKSLKWAAQPIDWSLFIKDREIPDAPEKGSVGQEMASGPTNSPTERNMADTLASAPSLIATLKLPARHWKSLQTFGTKPSEDVADHNGSDSGKKDSNAVPASRDVEILGASRNSKRYILNFDGENRNPLRKTTVSGIKETDLQHYHRLSARFDKVEGLGQASQSTTYGCIMFDNRSGALLYRRGKQANWERAVFHYWIRDEISDIENGKGEDVENFEHGILSGDITCFSSFRRRPSNRAQSSFSVGNLRYDGILVIDYDLSPVRAFPEFPLVLSSQFAGLSMRAAQQQNSGIKEEDFRARMPPVIQESIEGKLVLRPLYSIEVLSARIYQSREDFNVPTDSHPISNRGKDPTHNAEAYEGPTGSSGQAQSVGNKNRKQTDKGDRVPDLKHTRFAAPRFLPQDSTDSRNKSPTSANEAVALWEALEITAEHFLQLTGREPLRNEDRSAPSYCAQWMDMQNQLKQIWDRTPPAPSLTSRGKWTGGIVNWDSAELSGRG